jgi:hypothetical protein
MHAQTDSLLDRLQLFAGLEAHGFSGRNRYFCAGTRVAANAGLARADIEYAKSSEFNAMAAGQRLLHALENGFHRQFSLGFGNAGSGDHFVDNVELDHERLPDVL